MFTYGLTEQDRTRVLVADGFIAKHGTVAAENYLTVDPASFMEKCTAAGLHTRRIPCMKGRHFEGAWKDIVEVLEDRPETGYQGGSAWLFSHDGKAAVRARAGAIRVACQNQFYAPVMRFVHTSHAIRDFWIDPIPYVRHVLMLGKKMPERLESLKGIDGGIDLVQAALAPKPRLLRRTLRIMGADHEDAGMDLWAAFQAMTRTRSPLLTVAAGDWLGNDDTYEALRAGRLPEEVATRFDTAADLVGANN